MRFTEFDKLDMVALGTRCLEARTKIGLSQREMAKIMGYSSPTVISNKETGHTYPSVDDINILSKLSGLSVEWLVTGENKTKRLYCMNEMEVTLLTRYRLLTDKQKTALAFHLMMVGHGESATKEIDTV